MEMIKMNNSKRRKGLTLSELMIYIALAGIVLTGVFGVLTGSMRYYRQTRRMTEMYSDALIILSNVSNDISETTGNSVSMDSSGTSAWIAFASSKTVTTGTFSFNSDGDVLWEKWVAYYIETDTDGTKKLVRKEIPFSSSAVSPGKAPYSSRSALESASSRYKKIIAEGVDTFEIKQGDSVNCYEIKVKLSRTTDTARPSDITAATEMYARN